MNFKKSKKKKKKNRKKKIKNIWNNEYNMERSVVIPQISINMIFKFNWYKKKDFKLHTTVMCSIIKTLIC